MKGKVKREREPKETKNIDEVVHKKIGVDE